MSMTGTYPHIIGDVRLCPNEWIMMNGYQMDAGKGNRGEDLRKITKDEVNKCTCEEFVLNKKYVV